MNREETAKRAVPVIAILAPNILMGVGLRSILEKMIPFASFLVCDDFSSIERTEPEELFHIFVMANIVVERRDFFEARRNKTIILTSGTPHAQLLEGYPQINIAASQEQIEQTIRQLHTNAHGERQHPTSSESKPQEVLSSREIDVLRLVVEGYINKEIAHRLNIAITTVISHRKNIVEKLGIKSVAGLTIYAVMKRYIDI
ncbi:MAG: LuxR C-terminal-related transcriptional regulator [Rikenellaceae bacterium]